MYYTCVAQDAFLKYCYFSLKGIFPYVKTNAKRIQVCTSRHAVLSITLAHTKNLHDSGEVITHSEGLIQTGQQPQTVFHIQSVSPAKQ